MTDNLTKPNQTAIRVPGVVSSSRDFGVEQFFRADDFRADDPSPSFNICCYFRSSYLLDLPKRFCVFYIVFVSVIFIYRKKGFQKTFFLQKDRLTV